MLREVFSQTGANSRVLKTDGEDMQNRDHACFFSAAHAAKDSGIALKLAKAQGLNLPLAAATKKQYDRMVSRRPGRTGQIRHRRTDLQGTSIPTRTCKRATAGTPSALTCSTLTR